MATEMTSSQLSPKAAFARIWKRLTDAVAEGKRKAGVSAKTESIMEAAKGGKLDMIDLGEDNLFGDPEQGMLDLGEENLFGGTESGEPAEQSETSAPSEPGTEVPTEQQPAPAGRVLKGVVGGKTGDDQKLVITKRKPTRLTKAEREEEARRARERQRQIDAENNYSVAEVQENWKSLFDYAYENREYLKDAGPLITEPEMMSIFFAEYRNYIVKERNGEIVGREHKGATDKVIHDIPNIVEEKSQWLLSQFNERLHGRGDFLKNGSLMHYLIRIGHQRNTRTAQLSNEDLVPAGEEGLCNFIIARNLQACKQFVNRKMGSLGVPESARTGLALDILTNGINKPDILRKIGGVGSKMYSSPLYGSVERKGDDICIVGPKPFLSEFLTRFNSFIKKLVEDPQVPGVVEPATDKRGNELGRGLYMVRFPETPYLGRLNEAVDEGIFVPIQFGAGTVSLSGGGSGEGAEGESRYSDILQTHQSTDSAHAVDYSVGETLSANNLMDIMEKPGFSKLVDRYGVKALSDDAKVTDGSASTVKMSKLVATLLGKIAERNGVPCSVETIHGISVAKLGTDRSLAAIASKKEGISPQENSAIVGLLGYNNTMLGRVGSMKGNDVSDLGSMGASEMKRLAIPTIHLGKLGEQCLSGRYDDPNAVAFAKGYLINALGGAVGFADSDDQIFSSAADFARTAHFSKLNAAIIKQEIASLDPRSLPGFAQMFEEKGDGRVGHEEDDEPEGGWFYDSRKMVTLDKVGRTTIARAIEFINPGTNGAEVVKGAVEAVGGLERGYLDEYMEAIMKGDSAAVSSMAGDIVNSKGGVISVKLSNIAAETVKRDTSAKDKAAARRKARRGTWFD